MADKVKVKLSAPWRGVDGDKNHVPGDVVTVDEGTANGLRDAHYGVVVTDAQARPRTAKKTAAKKTAAEPSA